MFHRPNWNHLFKSPRYSSPQIFFLSPARGVLLVGWLKDNFVKVVGFCQESVVFCIGGQFWVLNNARMGTRLIFFQGAQKWPVLGQNWVKKPKNPT